MSYILASVVNAALATVVTGVRFSISLDVDMSGLEASKSEETLCCRPTLTGTVIGGCIGDDANGWTLVGVVSKKDK